MSVLKFDKTSLGNLEYSLKREMLATDRTGGYMSTTIVCCNTRKYHGLMVCPIDNSDKSYVMLSSLDETIIQHDQAFNLALHKFPGNHYEPKGHKYIVDFQYTPTPTITYRVGGVVLKKELLWVHSRAQLLVRYTLVDCHSETTLRLRPFLAFRDKHSLSKANMEADGHSYEILNGVKCRLYESFPWLNMQTDKAGVEFIAAPDWWENFEYEEEQARGYDYHEDLLTPGYFETKMTKGESITFSCSFEAMESGAAIDETFEAEIARRTKKIDFMSILQHSARQLITRRDGKTEVVAGYPWFGRWGRDTFIALPGLTLSRGDVQSCLDVLDTITSEMQDGLFPNMGSAYNSVDAPLWFFHVLQQLENHKVKAAEIWERYGQKMKDILNAYKRGVGDLIRVHDNGLVWAQHPQLAMTWMDAVVNGKPVTGREGYQVEINAMWYNAVCYTLELAKKAKDKEFCAEWKDMPAKTKESFLKLFWIKGEKASYLADYVNLAEQSQFIRPNQIIACALEYKMLDTDQQMEVINVVKQHLLTPKGLRTLSPRNPLYCGRYMGSQPERDSAYHQGTVWVWPLEFYVKACFDMFGKAYLPKAQDILANFEEDLTTYGIGSIPEIYDGDPPHTPRGAISQAWSVSAVLRIAEMISCYKRKRA